MTCKKCKTTIFSQYSGHFVSCDCRSCMIDQTKYYARYIGNPKYYYLVEKVEYYDIIDWWYKYCPIIWDKGIHTLSKMNFKNTCSHLNYPFITEFNKSKYLYQFMLQVTQNRFSCYTTDNKYFVYVTVEKNSEEKYLIKIAGVDDSMFYKIVNTIEDVELEIKILTIFSDTVIKNEKGWLN